MAATRLSTPLHACQHPTDQTANHPAIPPTVLPFKSRYTKSFYYRFVVITATVTVVFLFFVSCRSAVVAILLYFCCSCSSTYWLVSGKRIVVFFYRPNSNKMFKYLVWIYLKRVGFDLNWIGFGTLYVWGTSHPASPAPKQTKQKCSSFFYKRLYSY